MLGFDWFKFTPDGWMRGAIQECSYDTRGRFIQLVCHYWPERIKGEELSAEKMRKRGLLNDEMESVGAVKVDGDTVRILFVEEQIEALEQSRQRKSDSARKREARKKTTSTPQVVQNLSQVPDNLPTSTAQKRGEEKRGEEKTRREGECAPERNPPTKSEVWQVFKDNAADLPAMTVQKWAGDFFYHYQSTDWKTAGQYPRDLSKDGAWEKKIPAWIHDEKQKLQAEKERNTFVPRRATPN